MKAVRLQKWAVHSLFNKRNSIIAGVASIVVFAILLAYFTYTRPDSNIPVSTKRRYSTKFVAEVTAEQLMRLTAVTAANGKVFAADGKSGEIKVFDWTGKLLERHHGIPRSKTSGKQYPVGLAIDEKGRIYIADMQNRDIWITDSKGVYSDSLKNRGAVFGRIIAMAYKDGRLYISDASDQKIKVFEPSGKKIFEFGGRGSAKGRFSFATGLAIDNKGRIYAADSNNHRVQVFDEDGKFLRMLEPPPKHRFALPRGVAVDADSNVYVLDTFNKSCLVFGAAGEFITSFDVENKEDFLLMPNSIAIDDKHQRIFVTDKMDSKIAIWAFSQ